MAINEGHYPVDPSTPVGLVRLLLGDTDPSDITGDPPDQVGSYLWYGDTELAALIDSKVSPEATAVYILRMIAITPALKLKKWSSADLAVDGPAITKALLEAARDIENGNVKADSIAASEYFNVVNTGASIFQPAAYDSDLEWDPTIPRGII